MSNKTSISDVIEALKEASDLVGHYRNSQEGKDALGVLGALSDNLASGLASLKDNLPRPEAPNAPSTLDGEVPPDDE